MLAAVIIQAIISIALSVAANYIQQSRAQDKSANARKIGLRGTTSVGTAPGTFILGYYGTPGHRLAPRLSWTETDGTPNEYIVDVIGVSLLPARGLDQFYVFGEAVTLDATPHADYGYPVLEYRDDDTSEDHMWIRFYDGTQTEADAYLIDKFGSHPSYPWDANMIGVGMAYAIITCRAHETLFPRSPHDSYYFGVNGIELDDTRGDDEHENPAVAIRTILKGIYYDGTIVYGPQKITDYQLPTTQWEPEMDKCDAAVSISGGGTEKAYRCGLEVSCDVEPYVTINELLKGCNGRIAEIGGTYKILVGEPGSSVVSFTDADVIVSEGQSYAPFPRLEEIINGVRFTYPSPEDGWNVREGRPRFDGDYEAADDDRRLIEELKLKSVPFRRQAQRVAKATLLESRKFRRHSHTMKPAWWQYEPLDVVTWTSSLNGYSSKQFLVTAIDDLPDAHQVPALLELDPDDYDWSSDDELNIDPVDLTPRRPSAQSVPDWAVAPGKIKDEDDADWRPTLSCSFRAALADVKGIRIQWRRVGYTDYQEGRFDYDRSDTSPTILLPGHFRPAVEYEARAKLRARGKRKLTWSSWLSATTPDLRIRNDDIFDGVVDTAKLAADVKATLADFASFADDALTRLGALEVGDAGVLQQINDLGLRVATNEGALVSKLDRVTADTLYASATSVTTALAQIDDLWASGQIVIQAQTPPAVDRDDPVRNAWVARVGMMVRSVSGGQQFNGGFWIDLRQNGATRIVAASDRFYFVNPANGALAALFDTSNKFNTAYIPTLTADHIDVDSLFAKRKITIGDILTNNNRNDDGQIKRDILLGKIKGIWLEDGTVTATHIQSGTVVARHIASDSIQQMFGGRSTRVRTYNGTFPPSVVRHSTTKWANWGAQSVIVTATFYYYMVPHEASNDRQTSEPWGRSVTFGIYEYKKGKRKDRDIIGQEIEEFYGFREKSPKRNVRIKTVTAIHRTNYGSLNFSPSEWRDYRARWAAFFNSNSTGYSAAGTLIIFKSTIDVAVFHMQTDTPKIADVNDAEDIPDDWEDYT